MNDLDNKLEDTRKHTLVDPQNSIDICDKKIKEAVNKVFPTQLREVNKILNQYKKIIKSNILARFEHFDFEELDIQMKKVEDIDKTINKITYVVNQLIDDMMNEKNNIDKISKKWIDDIDTTGRSNINAIEVVEKGISQIKNRMEEVELSKNSLLNLTNILLVIIGAVTAYNTYYLFY